MTRHAESEGSSSIRPDRCEFPERGTHDGIRRVPAVPVRTRCSSSLQTEENRRRAHQRSATGGGPNGRSQDRPMTAMPHVGIVGGSIGGLTAALVLRDLGCEVDVFERSGTALEARGAGIGLHPMTTRYFDESSDLDATMVEIELPWLQFLSASGDRIHQERMNYRFSSWNTIYRRSRPVLRRVPLPPRERGRRIRPGRPRGDGPPHRRRRAHLRHAGVRGRNLVRRPGKASAGRPGAVRGLRGVAGDGARIGTHARELRGPPRLHHVLPAALRPRARLSHPEPRRRAGARAAAREPGLVSQLRGRRGARRPDDRPLRAPPGPVASAGNGPPRARGVDEGVRRRAHGACDRRDPAPGPRSRSCR